MNKGIVVFLAVAGLSVSQASAALLTYEGFNYTAGNNIDNQNGGTGWDANWGQFLGGASSYTSVAGSLADPTSTLATSGNHVDTAGTFGGRYNAFPGYGANGSTAYFSVLIRLNYTPTTNSFAGLQLFNNTGQGDLFIGKNGGGLNWGLEHTGADSYSGVAAVLDQTVLLVLRADYTSGNDTFKLYYAKLSYGIRESHRGLKKPAGQAPAECRRERGGDESDGCSQLGFSRKKQSKSVKSQTGKKHPVVN